MSSKHTNLPHIDMMVKMMVEMAEMVVEMMVEIVKMVVEMVETHANCSRINFRPVSVDSLKVDGLFSKALTNRLLESS